MISRTTHTNSLDTSAIGGTQDTYIQDTSEEVPLFLSSLHALESEGRNGLEPPWDPGVCP